MSNEETAALMKWAPIAVGAVTAGLVVGQAGDRLGLGSAAALGVVSGLLIAGSTFALLRLLKRRR